VILQEFDTDIIDSDYVFPLSSEASEFLARDSCVILIFPSVFFTIDRLISLTHISQSDSCPPV
jgi:hypothetical protein